MKRGDTIHIGTFMDVCDEKRPKNVPPLLK